MKQDSLLNRFASVMIKKYRFVYLMMVLVMIVGAMAYQGLPKEVFPELRFPYAIVSVAYPGASPEDVEKQITIKIEDAVSGTGEIKSIESTASPGLSVTVIKYKMGANLSKKLEKVKELVEETRSELPKKHERPVVEEYDVTKIPTMILTISSDASPQELKGTAKLMSDQIKRVEGVSKVKLVGEQQREIQIAVDATKLAQYGVSEETIEEVVKSRNIDVPAGVKTLNGKNYNIRINNSFENIEEIKRLVLKIEGGLALYMEDVAKVSYGYEKGDGYAITPFRFKQDDEVIKKVIAIQVLKENATDTIKINDEIRSVVRSLKEENRLGNTEIEYSTDMSKYIRKSIKDVFDNALSGLLVVIIVLFFFIDFRESIIVALVIPLSMMMTVATFKYVGVSFNIMSLLGLIIALGMLVDNAIVVIESIQEARKTHSDLEKASEEATKTVAAAILASTVTTVVAFIPLTLMKGDDGILIRPIPIATSIALISSYIVSIAVTPMLAARWLKNERNDRAWLKWLGVVLVFLMSLFAFSNNGQITVLAMILSPLMAGAIWYKLFKNRDVVHNAAFIKKYVTGLKKVIAHKKKRFAVLALSLVLVIVSTGLLASDLVPKQAMPTADTTDILISYNTTIGGSLEDAESIAMAVHELLKSKDYVANYVANIGGSQENRGSINLTLVNKNERSMHSNDIISELNRALRKIPGAKFIVGEEDGEASNQVSIQLFANNLESLKSTAKHIKNVTSIYKGVDTSWTSADDGVPQLMMDINYEKATSLSLDPRLMSFQMAAALRGTTLTEVRNETDDENIKLLSSTINSMDDLENFEFTSSRRRKVPFNDVAKLIEKNGISKIERKDNQKILSVVLQLEKNVPVKSIVEAVKADIENGAIEVPKDVVLKFGGSFESMENSFNDLFQKMIIAIILIFAVLVLQFDSYKQPFVIMMAVPMAIIGVAFGYFLTGQQFGIMSFMGLVALSGIVVNDSIVLIDTINQKRRLEGMNYLDAIIEGTRSRFIPVLATSVTTIVGVLPLALYNEDYSQIAWTLIFGLTASTVLILALVPIILAQMEGRTIQDEEANV